MLSPPDVSCRWEIRKAPLDTSGVRWNYDGPFKASGRPHTVTLAGDSAGQGFMGKMLGHSKEVSIPGLPAGPKVCYEGNIAKAPGVYEARAYLTIPPQANHDVSEPICLRWEIIDG